MRGRRPDARRRGGVAGEYRLAVRGRPKAEHCARRIGVTRSISPSAVSGKLGVNHEATLAIFRQCACSWWAMKLIADGAFGRSFARPGNSGSAGGAVTPTHVSSLLLLLTAVRYSCSPHRAMSVRELAVSSQIIIGSTLCRSALICLRREKSTRMARDQSMTDEGGPGIAVRCRRNNARASIMR